jgi:hypothetical protein
MDPSGNMMSLHTLPHKQEYVLYLDSSMRKTCKVVCPLKIPELEDEGIKFELDALGLMREMSPKEYDEITKQLENDTFMFVGHKKNTLIYFGCKPMIKRGNQYLQGNIPGARIVAVVITDQLDNKKIPEIAPHRKELKYKPLTSGPFGESIGLFIISN